MVGSPITLHLSAMPTATSPRRKAAKPRLSPKSRAIVKTALDMVEECRERMSSYTPAQRAALEREARERIARGASTTATPTRSTALATRRMWAMIDPRFHVLNEGEKRLAKRASHDTVPTYVPVAVIPLDDPEALVRLATSCPCSYPAVPASREAFARSMLATLGLLPATRKPRRKGATRT